jgi:hypothetical protein
VLGVRGVQGRAAAREDFFPKRRSREDKLSAVRRKSSPAASYVSSDEPAYRNLLEGTGVSIRELASLACYSTGEEGAGWAAAALRSVRRSFAPSTR